MSYAPLTKSTKTYKGATYDFSIAVKEDGVDLDLSQLDKVQVIMKNQGQTVFDYNNTDEGSLSLSGDNNETVSGTVSADTMDLPKRTFYQELWLYFSDGTEDVYFVLTHEIIDETSGVSQGAHDYEIDIDTDAEQVAGGAASSLARTIEARDEAEGFAANLNRAGISAGDAGKIERIKKDESGWFNADLEVNNFQELMNIDFSEWEDGTTINVLGFYEAGDGGGTTAPMYLDLTEDRANHDGGGVIDYTHSVAPGDPGWWTSENTGTGCLKRPQKEYAQIEEFGGIGDGSNVTAAFEAAELTSGWVKFGPGHFLLDRVSNRDFKNLRVTGSGYDTFIEAVTDYAFYITEQGVPNEGWLEFESFRIEGSGRSKSGIYTETSLDRLYGILFLECDKAIEKLGGFGVSYNECFFAHNNYGIYAEAASDAHVGLDSLYRCHMTLNKKAAIYLDSSATAGGGVTRLNQCRIEGNEGFAVFLNDFNRLGRPFLCDSTWFESNGTASSVDINGTTYSPNNKSFYAANNTFLVLRDMNTGGVTMKSGSKLVARNTELIDLEYDDDVTLDLSGLRGDQQSVKYPVGRLTNYKANRSACSRDINNREALSMAKENKITKGSFAYSNPIEASADWNVTQVSDGLFPQNQCYEVEFLTTISNNKFIDRSNIVAFEGGPGKWQVFTYAIKKISGNISYIQMNWASPGVSTDVLYLTETDEWQTFKVIQEKDSDLTSSAPHLYISDTDAAGVVRFSKMQALEFDKKQDAVDFLDSNVYMLDQEYLDSAILDADQAAYVDPSTSTAEDIANALINAGIMKSS